MHIPGGITRYPKKSRCMMYPSIQQLEKGLLSLGCFWEQLSFTVSGDNDLRGDGKPTSTRSQNDRSALRAHEVSLQEGVGMEQFQ